MDWNLVVEIIVVAILTCAIFYLYRKDKINDENMNTLCEFLDTMDDGTGLVAVLAGYAKFAVKAVEQLVKAGIIPKENEARKDAAVDMIINYAAADGIELDDDQIPVVEDLIETEVYNLKHIAE